MQEATQKYRQVAWEVRKTFKEGLIFKLRSKNK